MQSIVALERSLSAEPDNLDLRKQFVTTLRRLGPRPHYALVGGIESNLEALEMVLLDIKRNGIPELRCLGGLFGYGPNPAEVIDLIRSNSTFCLGSYREGCVLRGRGSLEIHYELCRWIRKQIKPSLISVGRVRKRWNYLQSLPIRFSEENSLFAYGSWTNPFLDILSYWQSFKNESHEVQSIFLGHRFKRELKDHTILFHSKSPEQAVMTSNGELRFPREIHNHFVINHDSTKSIVCIGSVGSLVNGTPLARYVEVIGEHVLFHQVHYNWERTISKLAQNSTFQELRKSGKMPF